MKQEDATGTLDEVIAHMAVVLFWCLRISFVDLRRNLDAIKNIAGISKRIFIKMIYAPIKYTGCKAMMLS